MAVLALTRKNRGQQQTDEILQYQMCRYISRNVVTWRILDFPIHNRKHQQLYFWECIQKMASKCIWHEKLQSKWAVNNNSIFPTLSKWFICKNAAICWYTFILNMEYNKTKVTKESLEVMHWDECTRCIQKNIKYFYLRILLHEICVPACFTDLKTASRLLEND